MPLDKMLHHFSLDYTKFGLFDRMLRDPEVAQQEVQKHNQRGEIQYLTPREYYEICAEMLEQRMGTRGRYNLENLVSARLSHTEVLESIRQGVKDGALLPLPFIDFVNYMQDGFHRMLVMAEIYGWDQEKFPVFIVKPVDEELHFNKLRYRQERELAERISAILFHLPQCQSEEKVAELFLTEVKTFLEVSKIVIDNISLEKRDLTYILTVNQYQLEYSCEKFLRHIDFN